MTHWALQRVGQYVRCGSCREVVFRQNDGGFPGAHYMCPGDGKLEPLSTEQQEAIEAALRFGDWAAVRQLIADNDWGWW